MFLALRRVHIAASDFARSRRFYGETLGLPEVGGFEKDWVEFGLGPVVIKLAPLRAGEVPSRNQVAIVLSTDTLDATLSALKERGVTVTRGPIEEFTGRFAEILDPDGYRLVIYQASEMHPDEEWVPSSRIEELVKTGVDEAVGKERERLARREAAARPVSKKAAASRTARKPLTKKAVLRKK